MSASPADVVREVYETWRTQDVAAACDLYADDVVFDWSRRQLHPLVAEGKNRVVRVTRELLEPFEDTRAEIEELVEDGERVIALVHAQARGRASGLSTEARVAHIWTIRGGRVLRMEYFGDRDEALATARER